MEAYPRTRLLAGQSLKSSVKHVWSMDRTDNSIVPTAGYALETSHVRVPFTETLILTREQELAGFGGDVRFIKQQLSAQWHVGLPFIRDSVSGFNPAPRTNATKRRSAALRKQGIYCLYLATVHVLWIVSIWEVGLI